MTRSQFCSKCECLKDPVFASSGYCRTCKSERVKELRAKRREEKGLPPFTPGRSPLCYGCGKSKGNINQSYCSACRNESKRKLRLVKIQSKDFVVEERANLRKKYESPLLRFQHRARRSSFAAIKDGTLIRKPCEVCGDEKVDGHHDDYSKPLDVRWLCRKHHILEHRREHRLKEL